MQSKKVTDLNDDCLEEICKYLNEDELLKLAKTDKRFISSCSSVFKRKYGTTITVSRNDSAEMINKTIMKMELFSGSITKLDVDCRALNGEKIYDAIEHCRETVEEISMRGGGTPLRKSFPKLQVLDYIDCNFIVSMENVSSTTLPQLSFLTFWNDYPPMLCIDKTFVQQSFTNLKHFGVVGSTMTVNDFKSFVHMNSQLQSFTFKEKMTYLDFAEIAEALPNLHRIFVDLTKVSYVNHHIERDALLPNVNKFFFILKSVDDLEGLPISMEKLTRQVEKLVCIFETDPADHEFDDFIKRCENLKDLEVYNCEVFYIKCLKNKRFLKHIDIQSHVSHNCKIESYICYKLPNIVEMVTTCPLLECIHFDYTFDKSDYVDLIDIERLIQRNIISVQSQIGDGWFVDGTLKYDEDLFMDVGDVEVQFSLSVCKKNHKQSGTKELRVH